MLLLLLLLFGPGGPNGRRHPGKARPVPEEHVRVKLPHETHQRGGNAPVLEHGAMLRYKLAEGLEDVARSTIDHRHRAMIPQRQRARDDAIVARERTVDREDAFDARGVGSRGVRAFTRRDRGDDRVHHDSIRFDASNGARLSRSRSNARVHPARATTTRVSRLYLYELPHGVTQSGHEDLLEVRNHVYRHAA